MQEEVNITMPHQRAHKKVATGKYTFEWLNKAGQVEHTETVNNAFTDHWNKYLEGLGNSYAAGARPVACEELSPIMVALYDDPTEVVTSVGYREYGILRGTIDHSWDNADNSHPTKGNRTQILSKIERIDANTQKITWVGEFGTNSANGVSNKIRMFGTSDSQVRDSADTNNNNVRIELEKISELTQGINCIQSREVYNQALGGWYLPTEGWSPSTFDDSGSDHDTFRIGTKLHCANPRLIAMPKQSDLDWDDITIALCPLARGSGFVNVPTPKHLRVTNVSADAVVLHLPSEKGKEITKNWMAGSLADNDDYVCTILDGPNLSVYRYESAKDYARVDTQFTVTLTEASALYSYASCTMDGDILTVVTYNYKFHSTIFIYQVDMTTGKLITDGKVLDASVVEPGRSFQSAGTITDIWEDMGGFCLAYSRAYSSKTAFTEQSSVVVWFHDSQNIVDRRQYKILGVRGVYDSSPSGTIKTIYDAVSNGAGYLNFSRYSFSNIYVGQPPSTTASQDVTSRGALRYRVEDKTWVLTSPYGQAYVIIAHCPILEPLISEAIIPERNKTTSNALRVTYALTISDTTV